MNYPRFKQIMDGFANKRILVIGDLILDEFVWGKVGRISPEAPVPVVEVVKESSYPGGAANVARNLREFCKAVKMMGVIGRDAAGEKLRRLMAEEGIDMEAVQEDPAYQTIVKTRIIARTQQVVRVDREKIKTLAKEQTQRALSQLEKMLPELDAIIVEDYGKGLLHQEFVSALAAMARESGTLVAVDPNPGNPLNWSGVNVIKPNRAEAFASAGVASSDPVNPADQDSRLLEVGKILLQKWDAEQLLITLGEQGMMLFSKDNAPYHTPTRAREVFDVSGAGDTAIALYTLALAAGATAAEAAEVSNHASGIVVGKLGTATVLPDELEASFRTLAN